MDIISLSSRIVSSGCTSISIEVLLVHGFAVIKKDSTSCDETGESEPCHGHSAKHSTAHH